MQVGSSTIWGRAQHVRTLQSGIWSVETASHGGIKLDRANNAKVPKGARREGGWYEEDCDAVIPMAVFPAVRAAFTASEDAIRKSLKSWNSDELDALDAAGLFTKEGKDHPA